MEIVRKVTAGFNRDGSMPEDLIDPDIEFFNLREFPLPGPYRGYEGLREWKDAVFEVLEDWRFEVEDFNDVDETNLVVFNTRLLGRARHTGIAVDLHWTAVQWFRDGRIYRSEAFTERVDALEAAGLSE